MISKQKQKQNKKKINKKQTKNKETKPKKNKNNSNTRFFNFGAAVHRFVDGRCHFRDTFYNYQRVFYTKLKKKKF